MNTPQIFISYTHEDEVWKDRIVAHLAPLRRSGRVDIWDDRRIATGADWSKEVAEAMDTADVAVLLISADFLASDFILNEEIPRLLGRRQREGLVILPVIVRPCAWGMVDWLSRIQVLPKDGEPLSYYDNQDIAIVQVVRRIIELTEIVAANKERSDRPAEDVLVTKLREKPQEDENRIRVFISHENDDGDFAEVLKLKLEKMGIDAWTDVDRLRVGDDWRQEIDDAIRKSSAVIAVMTPRAKESEYVTYEWAFAWGGGVKVVPIMLKPTQLHPRLESLQYLDFTNRRARPWSRLIEELKSDGN